MALSTQRKLELAAMSLPSEKDIRERIQSFVWLAGLTLSEFAEQIGYSVVAVSHFLHGRYGELVDCKAENTLAFRAAAKEFMDLYDLSSSADGLGKHYPTSSYEEVRRAALQAMRKGTAYTIDGPPGVEKTWSLLQVQREVREKQLGRFIYVYARVNHSPQSFLREVCVAAGVSGKGTIDQIIRKLRFFLTKGRTLLAVDEAQHLDHAGLEVLRQLLDLPPHFGVLLVGSHDLTLRLSHWQMEQWRSRLRKTIYLNGPTKPECRNIVRAEFGALDDMRCDQLIDPCYAKGVRIEMKDDKRIEKPFRYISARDFFFAIERAQETLAIQPKQKDEVAA